MTAFLFNAGTMALSVFLGPAGGSSLYGTAASVLALLMYYSAQVFFFGAEVRGSSRPLTAAASFRITARSVVSGIAVRPTLAETGPPSASDVNSQLPTTNCQP